MDRRLQNYTIDMMMLIAWIMAGVTGIIKWPGLVHTLGLSYRGLPMKAINTIHDLAGIAALILAAIHILLHWKWLAEMTKSVLKMKGNKKEKA